MKITCNQQILSKTLNTVSKAVPTRTTLPILKGILLKAKGNNTLTLITSNLEISIQKTIHINVEKTGFVVIPFKLFSDIIRKLPNKKILLEKVENGNILIRAASSEFMISSLSINEFPKIIDQKEKQDHLLFDAKILKNMINKISFAASIDESKGILMGVLIEIHTGSISMVALDGYRLAISTEQMTCGDEGHFIISAKIINEISKIIAEESDAEKIKIYLKQKKAIFCINMTEIVLRLMEGDYIKYRDIMPTQSTTNIIINKVILQESLERASLLAREGKNNLVKMAIKNNLLTITSRSEEGNLKEKIIIKKKGNDLEIGFNSKFVIDVLKVIDDNEISMYFMTETSPCTVKPVSGNSYEYLILPVRISNV